MLQVVAKSALLLKSWNCRLFSMNITRYWVNPIVWAIAYQQIIGSLTRIALQIISEHLSEGVFRISCLSFELHPFYCVHNSTTSIVIVASCGQIWNWCIAIDNWLSLKRLGSKLSLTLLRCHKNTSVTGVEGSFQTPNYSVTSLQEICNW